MTELDALIKELEEQETELRFERFTNEMALELGLALVEAARIGRHAVTIDISRTGQLLFHYAFAGTSPDNDQWIVRKNRVVERFHHSSLLIATRLKRSGKTLEEKFNLSSADYAAAGGAFPITLAETGVVGTVTVSGLTQEEDHALVVQVLRKYLSSIPKGRV